MAYESALDNARLARANEKAAAYENAAREMIAQEKAELIAAVAQFEVLLDNYDLQPDNHSKRALQEFLKVWPNIADYDSRGNYVGRASNENGWTP